jgi:hypothetical protein
VWMVSSTVDVYNIRHDAQLAGLGLEGPFDTPPWSCQAARRPQCPRSKAGPFPSMFASPGPSRVAVTTPGPFLHVFRPLSRRGYNAGHLLGGGYNAGHARNAPGS